MVSEACKLQGRSPLLFNTFVVPQNIRQLAGSSRNLRFAVIATMAFLSALLVCLLMYDFLGNGSGASSAAEHLLSKESKTGSKSSQNDLVVDKLPEQETNLTTETPTEDEQDVPTFQAVRGRLPNHSRPEWPSYVQQDMLFPAKHPGDVRGSKELWNPFPPLPKMRPFPKKYKTQVPMVTDKPKHPSSAAKERVGDVPYIFERGMYPAMDQDTETGPYPQMRYSNPRQQVIPLRPNPRPFRASNNWQAGNSQATEVAPYNFKNPFPQINNYRYPSDVKSIQDIIKYLEKEKTKEPPKLPMFMGPKGIKFSGVYMRPQYDEDADNSNLNGHAYIADPFYDFKPLDPAEINMLASNNYLYNTEETSKIRNPDIYFPKPPINFGKTSIKVPPQNIKAKPGATHTSVIYRPFGSKEEKIQKKRPLSVILDIYPMIDDLGNPVAAGSKKKPNYVNIFRPGTGNKLLGSETDKIKYLQNANSGFRTLSDEEAEAKHQMIVHLNLYPRRKNRDRVMETSSTNTNKNGAGYPDDIYNAIFGRNFQMRRMDEEGRIIEEDSSTTMDDSPATAHRMMFSNVHRTLSQPMGVDLPAYQMKPLSNHRIGSDPNNNGEQKVNNDPASRDEQDGPNHNWKMEESTSGYGEQPTTFRFNSETSSFSAASGGHMDVRGGKLESRDAGWHIS